MKKKLKSDSPLRAATCSRFPLDTPFTNSNVVSQLQRLKNVDGRDVVWADDARRLERERDEWKKKYIQQNKDLGCEMMDPNGTIWEHSANLEETVKSYRDQLTYLSKSKATEMLRLSDMIDKREEALGHIAAIMREKGENGEDLLIGSPEWKSVIRWSIYFQDAQPDAGTTNNRIPETTDTPLKADCSSASCSASWMPIKTAPNSLNVILVTDGEAVWTDQKISDNPDDVDGDYYFNGHENWEEVTHWMPIPSPLNAQVEARRK